MAVPRLNKHSIMPRYITLLIGLVITIILKLGNKTRFLKNPCDILYKITKMIIMLPFSIQVISPVMMTLMLISNIPENRTVLLPNFLMNQDTQNEHKIEDNKQTLRCVYNNVVRYLHLQTLLLLCILGSDISIRSIGFPSNSNATNKPKVLQKDLVKKTTSGYLASQEYITSIMKNHTSSSCCSSALRNQYKILFLKRHLL